MKKITTTLMMLLVMTFATKLKAQTFSLQYNTTNVATVTGSAITTITSSYTNDTLYYKEFIGDVKLDFIFDIAEYSDYHMTYTQNGNAYLPMSSNITISTFTTTIPLTTTNQTIRIKLYCGSVSGNRIKEFFVSNYKYVAPTPCTTCTNVGIFEETQKKENKAIAYPNPSNDVLTIKFNTAINSTIPELYAITGEKIKLTNEITIKSTNEIVLDTKNLPPGNYFVTCNNQTIKFSKQ